jgi:hypothetical protein
MRTRATSETFVINLGMRLAWSIAICVDLSVEVLTWRPQAV